MTLGNLVIAAFLLAPIAEMIFATWNSPRHSMIYVYTAWTGIFALLTTVNFINIFTTPADYSFVSSSGWLDRLMSRIGLFNPAVFWFAVSLTLAALSFVARRHCKLALAQERVRDLRQPK